MTDTLQNIGDDAGSADRSVLVGERFEKTALLFSTRTSEGYEALEKGTGEKVYLWILRYPLQYPSDEANRFVRRLKEISKLPLPSLKFKSFGVDAAGTAYLVTEWVPLGPVMDAAQSITAQEGRFCETLRCLARIHGAGMVLGDISEDTFALSESGQLFIIGLLGSFDIAARETANLPPGATLHYFSPEQRMGGVADVSSDVFALGVFGYRFFTGRYPSGDKHEGRIVENPVGTAPAPTFLRAELPRWVDDVLGKCLEIRAHQRYADANEILATVEQALSSGMPPGGTSAWSRRTLIVKPAQAGKKDEAAEARDAARRRSAQHRGGTDEESSAARSKLIKTLTWVFSIGFGGIIAGLIYRSIDSGPAVPAPDTVLGTEHAPDTKSPGDHSNVHTEYVPNDLKPLIAQLQSPDSPQEKRVQALARLAENEDPAAREALRGTLKGDRDPLLRRAAQRLLIDKVKKSGLVRSASVLEDWTQGLIQVQRDPTQFPAFGQMLDACTPFLTSEARRNALQEAYTIESKTALRLAGALSLDEPEPIFLPVLRKFLSAELSDEDLSGKGIGALLLSHPALGVLIDADFSKTVEKFSDSDLQWALGKIGSQPAAKGSAFLIVLSQEALRRKLLEPFRAVFLQALIDNAGSKTEFSVQQVLLRASVGEISQDDVDELGRWISMSTERVLLAVCATAKSQVVAVESFDVLAGRGLNTEPASSLIAWIKGKFWDYRKAAAKGIGIMGISDIASPEQIDEAFQALMPFAAGGLFRVISNTSNVSLVLEAVDRMGAIAGSGELLPLLHHNDKGVRIATVKALKDRNELIVLQGILRGYEHEPDEEVRAVYRENHWVTRDRGGPGKTLSPGSP